MVTVLQRLYATRACLQNDLLCVEWNLLLLARLHIVYGARVVTVTGVCRRLSSVGVCNTRICNVTYQEAARGGPVVLRPVMAIGDTLLLILMVCHIMDVHSPYISDLCHSVRSGPTGLGSCSSNFQQP